LDSPWRGNTLSNKRSDDDMIDNVDSRDDIDGLLYDTFRNMVEQKESKRVLTMKLESSTI